MEKVFVNSQGKVLATGGEALKVTASVDSNIIPSNIKKDVNILGVTGTYEGNGGSNVISFTVNGSTSNTYQAEKDMTWQEWINSAYYNSNYGFSITAEGYVTQGAFSVYNPTYYSNYTGYPHEYGCNVIKSNRIYNSTSGSND